MFMPFIWRYIITSDSCLVIELSDLVPEVVSVSAYISKFLKFITPVNCFLYVGKHFETQFLHQDKIVSLHVICCA